MKKLISIFLILALIATLVTVSNFSINAVEKEYQYESAFKSYAIDHGYKDFTYEEIGSGDHWTLVFAKCEGDACDKLIKGTFGDRVIINYADGQPFMFGYGVFWRRVGFVPLTEIWNNPYFEGLHEMFREYTDKTMTADGSTVWLLGDNDRDGMLTILDVTHLQKQLASLEAFPSNDTLPQVADTKYGADILFLSDIDRDGTRSVLDATLIQKRLANSVGNQDLEFTTLANDTSSPAAHYFKGVRMIASYQELMEKKEWFSEKVWNDLLLSCDEKFFAEHEILLYTDVESSTGYGRDNFRVYKDKFYEINFAHDRIYPSGGGATVMTNRLILLALKSKDVPVCAGINAIVSNKSPGDLPTQDPTEDPTQPPAEPPYDDSYLTIALSDSFNTNAVAVEEDGVGWKETFNGNSAESIENFDDSTQYGVMALLNSRAQYNAFMRKFGDRQYVIMHPENPEDFGKELEDIYDDEFFENYSLLVTVYRYVYGNYTTKVIATAVRDNTLYVALRTTNVPEAPHAAPIYSYNLSVNMVKKTEVERIDSLGLLLMREE